VYPTHEGVRWSTSYTGEVVQENLRKARVAVVALNKQRGV
jgi:hypothetical protein